jgi:hypothetical protein
MHSFSVSRQRGSFMGIGAALTERRKAIVTHSLARQIQHFGGRGEMSNIEQIASRGPR